MDSAALTGRISEELIALRAAIVARDADAIDASTKTIASSLADLATASATPRSLPPESIRILRQSTLECGTVLRRSWRTVQALQSLYSLFDLNEAGTYQVRS